MKSLNGLSKCCRLQANDLLMRSLKLLFPPTMQTVVVKALSSRTSKAKAKLQDDALAISLQLLLCTALKHCKRYASSIAMKDALYQALQHEANRFAATAHDQMSFLKPEQAVIPWLIQARAGEVRFTWEAMICSEAASSCCFNG